MRNHPVPSAAQRTRRESPLNRVVEACKFFQPAVSMVMYYESITKVGTDANKGMPLYLVTLLRQLKTVHALIAAREPFPRTERGKTMLRELKVCPLSQAGNPEPKLFIDSSDIPIVGNPCEVDGAYAGRDALKRVRAMEVPSRECYNSLGMLADLDIRKGILLSRPNRCVKSTPELSASPLGMHCPLRGLALAVPAGKSPRWRCPVGGH